jgi:hypothetical protein
MQVRYFVHHNGTHMTGPLSFQEIEAQLNSNNLFPTDYVYVGERGDWIPMLEFILVHGPKEKVMQATLQTSGARSPADDNLDWRRFASGIPAAVGTNDDHPQVIAAYPMMPAGAQAAAEELKKDLEPPPPPAPRSFPPPKPPRAARPVLRPAPRPPQRVDASAVARVEVLPARATRLTIQITGNARVGEELEILVVAQTENGQIDPSFNETVEIACDRPLGGLAPLHFSSGTARLRVRCLTQGAHQFSLKLNNSAPVNLARTDISQMENENGLVH